MKTIHAASIFLFRYRWAVSFILSVVCVIFFWNYITAFYGIAIVLFGTLLINGTLIGTYYIVNIKLIKKLSLHTSLENDMVLAQYNKADLEFMKKEADKREFEWVKYPSDQGTPG